MFTHKKSRLTALLLVLVLMMSMLPAAYAAGEVSPKMELSNDKGAYISPGDTVNFTIKISNAGDDNWNDVKLTSTLVFVNMVSGSVKIDGVTSNYTFSAAKKLTVNIGTITPGASKTVTFAATILDNVAAKITYSFTATGYNTNEDQRFTVVSSTFVPFTQTSAVPVIETVTEGDPTVTGTGVAGAVVTVTLPDGSTHNVTVAPNGRWTLNVPAGTTLLEGQIVKAHQTETDKLQSPTVQTTVIANPTYDGEATKTSANITTTTGDKANIGDVIEYTITATNNSTPSSQWPCVVTDVISEYVDFVPNSVMVAEGTGAPVSYPYDYDAATRVLTVDLGNIGGTKAKTLTFQVKINDTANGQTIENTADVGGIPITDPDPIDVIEKSKTPIINPVIETDKTVTGTGERVPGTEIEVKFQDGTVVTTTVDPDDGTWEVEVPDGVTLNPGDEITAIQKEPDKDPSDEASTEVQPNIVPIESLEKKSENLTTPTGKANVKDTIEYTITAKNEGTASSVWEDCMVLDTIPDGVTFVAGSVKINNVAATPAQYSYDADTCLLAVDLGDIVGGNTMVITFLVTIDSDAHNKTIENIATVRDIDAPDPTPIEVIEKSDAPIINDVIETDTTVTGEGVPGASITVIFPGGGTVTTTVEDDYTWTVDVPSNLTLHPDDVIYATQKEPDKDVSDQVSTVVKPNPDPVPSLAKSSQNLTTTTGDVAHIGDTIEYTITAKNEGATSTVWNCVVTDGLHAGLTFVSGSVEINGVRATAIQYSYESENHMLTFNLGNIKGGETKVITFQCKINKDAYGASIVNTAYADDGDIVAPDPDPIDVIEKSETPIIDDVLETDTTVTGTGEPGAEIVVKFPDGPEVTTTADPDDGTWEVEVPDDVTLKPGDEITAIQKEPDKDPSDEAKTIVKADRTLGPGGEITWYNYFGGQTAKAGDYLEFSAQVWNDGTASSTWSSAIAVVTLDENITFADFVQVNGILVSADRYTYDSDTNTLTVKLGNIVGGSRISFSFRTVVSASVPETLTQLYVNMELF